MAIALMSAPFEAFENGQIGTGYHQVNQYYIEKDSRLTIDAKQVLSVVLGICLAYNYDDSDGQIDYFDTNFYLHLAVGKWNKPFKRLSDCPYCTKYPCSNHDGSKFE